MTREDHLDLLIERQLHGGTAPTPGSDDEVAMLAAAEALVRLNELEAPPDLAARLKARYRAHMRIQHTSSIVFRKCRPRAVVGGGHARFQRPWVVALSLAAVLLLACLGAESAASSSLPGDPLYGVKHVEQQIALASAGNPAARARLQITQLQGALADLETEVNHGRSDGDIQQALGIVATETHNSQTAVASMPAEAEREVVEQLLTETLHWEQLTLYRLLARVDWPLRLACTQQLGVLSVPVPTVTWVSVEAGSEETLTLKLTGTNFAPGAHLVINGKRRGTVSQLTPTALVAELNTSDWPEGTNAVGILNPDGTAAQVKVSGSTEDHDGSRDGENPADQGIPGSCSTSGSADGHGGRGGDGNGNGGGGGAGSSGGTGSGKDGFCSGDTDGSG
jgi:uncharacterized membrane protein YgcG